MNWHNVTIERLVPLLLPVRLRRPGFLAFVRSLLHPVILLQDEIRYKMQHDSRVIYLEKVLNESFNVSGYSPLAHEVSKQIYIGPGEIPDEVYIFQNLEPDIPPYIGISIDAGDGDDVYLNTREELDNQYCDFTVVVPFALQISEIKLKSLVDYYKMAGKKYKIRYI